MSIPSTISDSASRDDGSWPVLARLPDVADELANASLRSRAAAAGFVSLRFDPPEGAEGGGRIANPPTQREGSGLDSQPGRPHILAGARRNKARGESPILPRSNPFAIPGSSLRDALAPVIRFLVLFALFTAIGTSVLTIGKRTETMSDDLEHATTASQRALEPPTGPTVKRALEAPPTPATASGPLGDKSPRTGLRAKERGDSANRNLQSAAAPQRPPSRVSTWQLLPQAEAHEDAVAGSPPDGSDTVFNARSTAPLRQPAIDKARTELPIDAQLGVEAPHPVRDDSPGAPAVASLPGYILAAPTQQAHHDNNQSSLH